MRKKNRTVIQYRKQEEYLTSSFKHQVKSLSLKHKQQRTTPILLSFPDTGSHPQSFSIPLLCQTFNHSRNKFAPKNSATRINSKQGKRLGSTRQHPFRNLNKILNCHSHSSNSILLILKETLKILSAQETDNENSILL